MVESELIPKKGPSEYREMVESGRVLERVRASTGKGWNQGEYQKKVELKGDRKAKTKALDT